MDEAATLDRITKKLEDDDRYGTTFSKLLAGKYDESERRIECLEESTKETLALLQKLYIVVIILAVIAGGNFTFSLVDFIIKLGVH